MSNGQEVLIRRATEADIPHIARINAQVFLGHRDNPETAERWVGCLSAAFPLYQYFVAEVNGEFAGYIGWEIQGGFLRPNPSAKLGALGASVADSEEQEEIELEQLGINPTFAGLGIATKLTRESLEKYVVPWILEHNRRIESDINCIVWFYVHNEAAKRVYEKCGFTEECGRRKQYGDREEVCLKRRIPFAKPAKEDN